MKINILASGSKGNCCFVETNNHKILVDLGITNKRIVTCLANINQKIEDIDIICITHEHIDHIAGMAQVLKKSNALVLLTAGTYNAILSSKNVDIAKNLFEHNRKGLVKFLKNDYIIYEPLTFDDLTITAIKTFHDSRESCGYIFEENNKKIVYITDTGYVHQELHNMLKNADCYVMETNHDPQILMASSRPYPLKMRILSGHGHMSNEDAFILLSNLITRNTKYVFCAHISDECNMTDIIEYTKNLVYKKLEFSIETKYIMTSQLQTEVYEI